MRRLLIRTHAMVFGLVAVFACEPKKEKIPITGENVREVLTRYGKDNPENQVIIESDYGTIKVRLYEDTPLHRANFVKLIKEGEYEEAQFYRIFYQFMIQAGVHPRELPYRVPAEFNAKYIHKKGALSMARSDENNPDLESSSSEFFIVHGSTYADYQVKNDMENFKLNLTPEQQQAYQEVGGYMSLDQKYTVFGEVTEGLDVVDRIAAEKVYEVDKPLKKIRLKIRLGVN